MTVKLTLQRFVLSMALFILVQGIGIVKAQKWGDLVYYYVPVTLLASAVFWAALVFSPVIL